MKTEKNHGKYLANIHDQINRLDSREKDIALDVISILNKNKINDIYLHRDLVNGMAVEEARTRLDLFCVENHPESRNFSLDLKRMSEDGAILVTPNYGFYVSNADNVYSSNNVSLKFNLEKTRGLLEMLIFSPMDINLYFLTEDQFRASNN